MAEVTRLLVMGIAAASCGETQGITKEQGLNLRQISEVSGTKLESADMR